MPDVPTANSTDFSYPAYRSRVINRNIGYSPAAAAALVVVSDFLTIWFVTHVAFLSGASAHRLQYTRYIAIFISTAAIIQVAFNHFEL